MQYCILAAGEGSRMAQEGVLTPKPLVKIGGQPMIGRLIAQMSKCGAESILVIVNEEMIEVRKYLDSLSANLQLPVSVYAKSTPSSMHSFYELSLKLKPDKFIMTTVDTIFRLTDMKKYAEAFEQSEADAFMAVTRHIDDEKPLFVDVDSEMNITSFSDEKSGSTQFVSGGIYGMNAKAFPIVRRCVESGSSRMRNFQRELLKEGLRVKAYDFGTILDVDHVDDIFKANEFLREKDN